MVEAPTDLQVKKQIAVFSNDKKRAYLEKYAPAITRFGKLQQKICTYGISTNNTSEQTASMHGANGYRTCGAWQYVHNSLFDTWQLMHGELAALKKRDSYLVDKAERIWNENVEAVDKNEWRVEANRKCLELGRVLSGSHQAQIKVGKKCFPCGVENCTEHILRLSAIYASSLKVVKFLASMPSFI